MKADTGSAGFEKPLARLWTVRDSLRLYADLTSE
jgi:hypothetical protein